MYTFFSKILKFFSQYVRISHPRHQNYKSKHTNIKYLKNTRYLKKNKIQKVKINPLV